MHIFSNDLNILNMIDTAEIQQSKSREKNNYIHLK